MKLEKMIFRFAFCVFRFAIKNATIVPRFLERYQNRMNMNTVSHCTVQKWKKVISLIMALCLVVGVLGGCGSKDPSVEGTFSDAVADGQVSDPETETSKETASSEGVENEETGNGTEEIAGDAGETEEDPAAENAEESAQEPDPSSDLAYTELNLGIPYFILDEVGFIHGDDLLKADDLKNALEVLLDDAQKALIGAVEPEEDKVAETAVEMLKKIADGKIMDAALAKVQMEDGLSRGEFAQLIYGISGCDTLAVSMEDLPVIGRDIDLETEMGRALILASIPYTVIGSDTMKETATSQAEGATHPLVETLLSCRWEPGKYLLKGYLYEAAEDGHVLRHETVGSHLVFDDNGRFTSGSQELDDRTAEMIYEQMQLNPKYDTYKLLRDCYEEVAWGTYYLHDLADPPYGDNCNNDWYIENALHALVDQCGACYSFAAGFCALARNLGYDAHCMSGKLFSTEVAHSWVYVDMPDSEGKELTDTNWRIFDPQLYWRGVGQHLVDLYDFNMFYLNPVESHRWRYVWDEPSTTCGVWTLEDLK